MARPNYLARVELDGNQPKPGQPAALYPGLTAEVMIVTNQATFQAYLLEPLSRSVNRAFREG